jgi:hypothetical protein
MLVSGKAEPACGRLIGEFRPAFAVSLGAVPATWAMPLPMTVFAIDQLWFSVAIRFGTGNGGVEGVEIVTIDLHRVPAEGFEALAGIVALRHHRHRVESDIVGIINQDEIVQPEVTRESDRLGGDTFLETAVAGETDDRLVENNVVGRVVFCRRHLRGKSVANRIADALAEGTGRCLDSDGLGELGVTGSLAVELAEVLYLLHRQVIARKMEPTVEEHAAVTRREDKTVAVEPFGLGGIIAEIAAEEHRADLRGAEGQAEVAGIALVDGIDGEAAGFGGGLGKGGVIQVAHGLGLGSIFEGQPLAHLRPIASGNGTPISLTTPSPTPSARRARRGGGRGDVVQDVFGDRL